MNISKAAKVKSTKRLGRGRGSGQGCTSGKGHKGQNCRSGGGTRRGFEGGQMPLIRRLPKRGFHNLFRTEYEVVNLSDIEKKAFEGEVTPDILRAGGLVKKSGAKVKILGSGELTRALEIKAHAFSRTAIEKIANVGGTATVIGA